MDLTTVLIGCLILVVLVQGYVLYIHHTDRQQQPQAQAALDHRLTILETLHAARHAHHDDTEHPSDTILHLAKKIKNSTEKTQRHPTPQQDADDLVPFLAALEQDLQRNVSIQRSL